MADPNPFFMLNETDRLIILTGIIDSAGPEGAHEDEIERQATVLAEWVVKTEIQSALLKMLRAGEVVATVKANGEINYGLTAVPV